MLTNDQIVVLEQYIATKLMPQLAPMGLIFSKVEQYPDRDMVSFTFNAPPVGSLVVNTQGSALVRASLGQIGDVIMDTLQKSIQQNGGMPMPMMPPQAPQTPTQMPPAMPGNTTPTRPTLNFNTGQARAPMQPPTPPAEPAMNPKEQAAVDLMIGKFEKMLERAAES